MKDGPARLFPLILGPANWAWFFAAAYATHAYSCARPAELPGTAIILGLAAIAIVISLWLLWRMPASVPGMQAAGRVLHVLSLVAIIWTAAGSIFIPAC